MMVYKRALLKLSGEQLAGAHEFGIDPTIARYLADEIKQVIAAGTQLVVVVGGGNMVRGAEIAGNGIRRVTADQMGMLSGLINAMALTDIFEDSGIRTRCLSSIYAEQLAESYSYRLAEKHLQQGRVVLVAGGMARPYFSHDTAATSIGLELECAVVMKASKVDGVYTADPAKDPSATKYATLSLQEAAENSAIKVMDKAAIGLAAEHNLPILVFDAFTPGSLLKAVTEQSVGTLVH